MKSGSGALLALALIAPGPLRAADLAPAARPAAVPGLPPFYVNLGLAGIAFDSKASIILGGAPLVGAGASATHNITGELEAGYRLTPNFAASVTLGIPPQVELVGTGTLSGVNLGKATYGPAMVTAHYHVTNFGPLFQPYIGGGASYTIVFRSQSLGLSDLSVRNAFGAVAQGGIEAMVNEHWGLVLDAKKIFVTTGAKGTAGGVPASASVRLDPLVVMGGVTYHL